MILQITIDPAKLRPNTVAARQLLDEEKKKDENLYRTEGGVSTVVGKALAPIKGALNFLKEPFLETAAYWNPISFYSNVFEGSRNDKQLPWFLRAQPLALWYTGVKQKHIDGKLTDKEYERQVRGMVSSVLFGISMGAATPATSALINKASPATSLGRLFGNGLKEGASRTLQQKMARAAVYGAADGAIFGGGFGVMEPLTSDQQITANYVIGQTLIGAAVGGVFGALIPVAGAGLRKTANPLRQTLSFEDRYNTARGFTEAVLKFTEPDPVTQAIVRSELPKTGAEQIAQAVNGRWSSTLKDAGIFGQMRYATANIAGTMFNRWQKVAQSNNALVQGAYDYLDSLITVPHYVGRKLVDLVLYDLNQDQREFFIRRLLQARMRGTAGAWLKEAQVLRSELGGVQTTMVTALETPDPANITDEMLAAVLKREQPPSYASIRALEFRARALAEEADRIVTAGEINNYYGGAVESVRSIQPDHPLIQAERIYYETIEPLFRGLYDRNGGFHHAQTDLPFIHAMPATGLPDILAYMRGDVNLYVRAPIRTSVVNRLEKELGREANETEIREAIGKHLIEWNRRNRFKAQAKVIGGAMKESKGNVITTKETEFAKAATFLAPAYHVDPNLTIGNALGRAMSPDRYNTFVAHFLLDPKVIPATSKLSTPPEGYRAVYIKGHHQIIEARLRALYDAIGKRYNLRPINELEVVGVDDLTEFSERRLISMVGGDDNARIEELKQKARFNLVEKARQSPILKKLLNKSKGKDYIPVETARKVFTIQDLKSRKELSDVLLKALGDSERTVEEQSLARLLLKGADLTDMSQKDGQLANKLIGNLNRQRNLFLDRASKARKILKFARDEADNASIMAILRGSERQEIIDAYASAFAVEESFIHMSQGAAIHPHYSTLGKEFQTATQGAKMLLDRIKQGIEIGDVKLVQNSIAELDNVIYRQQTKVSGLPRHSLEQLSKFVAQKLDDEYGATLGGMFDGDVAAIEQARKLLSTESQDYLRRVEGLGKKFVVFRAETRQAGFAGREHIPVATSLSPNASREFVGEVGYQAAATGKVNPVRPFLVDMDDVLFYGPAWRETAGQGATSFSGVAYGTAEQEVFVYSDRLLPIDVPANASAADIRAVLGEQFGIPTNSRLAAAGRAGVSSKAEAKALIPEPERAKVDYPALEALDVEGLGGLGDMQPVLGRYFMPEEYAALLEEVTTDPHRRAVSAALGMRSPTAQKWINAQPSQKLFKIWSNYMDWHVSALLATSVEVVAHSYRILGVLSRTPVGELDGNWAAFVPYFGPRMQGLVDMYHILNTPLGLEMEWRIAQLGGGTNRRFLQVGNDMGTNIGRLAEQLGAPKGTEHVLELGRDFLFAQPQTLRKGLYGFDQRARIVAATRVNEIFKRKLNREMSNAELRSFLDGFGKYNENLQNRFFFLMRKLKLSPFAGGQAGLIPREIASTILQSPGLPKEVLDELGSTVANQLRAEVFARGIGGTAAFLTIAQYIWTETFPWDNEQGHKLDLKIGYLEDGRAVYLPATTFMPGMSRALNLTGLRALAENTSDPARALGEAKTRLINTPITYGVAGAPGVGAGLTLTMGVTSYLNESGQLMRVVPPQSGSGFDKSIRQGFANAQHAVTAMNPTIEELFGFTYDGKTLPTGVRVINALTTGLKVGREPELAVSAGVRQQRAAFFEATRARVTEALAQWPNSIEDRKIFYKREAAKWTDPAQQEAAYRNMLRNDVNIRKARTRNVRRSELDQPF